MTKFARLWNHIKFPFVSTVLGVIRQNVARHIFTARLVVSLLMGIPYDDDVIDDNRR